MHMGKSIGRAWIIFGRKLFPEEAEEAAEAVWQIWG
jgi:hypothetical protein